MVTKKKCKDFHCKFFLKYSEATCEPIGVDSERFLSQRDYLPSLFVS